MENNLEDNETVTLTADAQDVLARIKRFDTSLTNNIQNLNKMQRKIAESAHELTIEVEQIKELKSSLYEVISTAVEKKMDMIVSELVQSVGKGFEEKNKSFIDTQFEKMRDAQDMAQNTVYELNKLILSHKKNLTIRKIGLGAIFCVSAFLTAMSINYFYPTYVHYHLTNKQSDSILVGEAVKYMLGDLTPKQKEKLLDLYERNFRESLSLSRKRGEN